MYVLCAMQLEMSLVVSHFSVMTPHVLYFGISFDNMCQKLISTDNGWQQTNIKYFC